MGWRPGPPSLEVEIEDVGDLDGFAFERRGLEPRSRSPGAEKLSEAWIGVAPVARQQHAILETPDRENAAFQRDKAPDVETLWRPRGSGQEAWSLQDCTGGQRWRGTGVRRFSRQGEHKDKRTKAHEDWGTIASRGD